MERWSSEMKEAGDLKENWYKTIKEKNYELGVKLPPTKGKKQSLNFMSISQAY